METNGSPDSIHASFVAAADEWLGRLRAGAPEPADDEGSSPGYLVNLGHRISDTLPTDVADRLEAFMDEFLTLSHLALSRDGGTSTGGSAELQDRLGRLQPAWDRLKRDLIID